MAQSRSFLIILLLVAGCAAPKPILYPNAHSQQVGKEVADRDIDECREMTKDAGATASQGKSGQVAGSTTAGGAIGSAAGAVGGAVVGLRDVAQWSALPAVRQQGFCAGSFAARLRAIPISSLCSAVLRSGGTILWVGSETRILRGWQGALPGAGKVDPHERSGHIGDDVDD